MLVVELVLDVAQDDGRLADAALAEEDDLEVVAVGAGHVLLPDDAPARLIGI